MNVHAYQIISTATSSESDGVVAKIFGFLSDSPFKKPSLEVVLAALDWTRQLNAIGFCDIDAFPGQNGEVLVSGIQGDFCFEVTIEPDLRVTMILELKDQVICAFDRVEPNDLVEKIQLVTRKIWISSGGFTLTSSTRGKNDLLASVSKIPPILGAESL